MITAIFIITALLSLVAGYAIGYRRGFDRGRIVGEIDSLIEMAHREARLIHKEILKMRENR